MTRQELAAALSALEKHLDERVQIVRVIVDETGAEIGRVVTGSFQQPRRIDGEEDA